MPVRVDRLPVTVNPLDRLRGGRSRAPVWLPALLMAAAVVASACGGGTTDTDDAAGSAADAGADESQATTTEEVTTTEQASTTQGEPTLLFGEFETLSGATFDLSTVAGEDVVLWFWAPW